MTNVILGFLALAVLMAMLGGSLPPGMVSEFAQILSIAFAALFLIALILTLRYSVSDEPTKRTG